MYVGRGFWTRVCLWVGVEDGGAGGIMAFPRFEYTIPTGRCAKFIDDDNVVALLLWWLIDCPRIYIYVFSALLSLKRTLTSQSISRDLCFC